MCRDAKIIVGDKLDKCGWKSLELAGRLLVSFSLPGFEHNILFVCREAFLVSIASHVHSIFR